MAINVKTVSGVGYLSIDMLRFWHSTVDCTSFELLPEISLLMGLESRLERVNRANLKFINFKHNYKPWLALEI